MSTQWITQFPPEILLLTIGAINNRNDLLSFALTCRYISQLIIPDKLKYFRISSLMKNINLCNHLLQNLHLCRGTHEFELTEKRSQNINDPMDYLPKIIHNMVNLSRVKVVWKNNDLEIFQNLLDALGDSGCRLEEFDFLWDIPRPSGGPGLLMTMAKLEDLQIWTKLDRTALQKLSIWVVTNWNLTQSPSRKTNWVGNILSDTPKLTHLNLTIQHVSLSINLLEYTWPNLENLIISGSKLFPKTSLQTESSSMLTDFFKRHPKLTTLSLPSSVYPHDTSPCITLECLPNLESFYYDGRHRPPLSEVLSPASARRLRHLTIRDNAMLSYLPYNIDIYNELTSLQTLCFPRAGSSNVCRSFSQILEVLAVHATSIQKIHLPEGINIPTYHAMLSVLRRFPRLTHVSGIPSEGVEAHDPLQLYKCRQLEYAIHVGHDSTPRVFRLIREFEHEDENKCMLVEVVAEKNPDFDMRTWGNFYNKI